MNEKPDIDFRPHTHPILAILPEHLKDPKNYEKIQRAILDAGASRHSHSDMLEWSACKYCQQKEWNRKEMMKKLGFVNGTQYMLWKKIHEEIKRLKLPKK